MHRNVTDKKQATIRIKWVRSVIGLDSHQEAVVRGLGLRRLQHVVERLDTPQIRGMVAKVPHLVKIVAGPAASARQLPPEYTVHSVRVVPDAEAPPESPEVAVPAAPMTQVKEEVARSLTKADAAARTAKVAKTPKKAKVTTKAEPAGKTKPKPKKAEPKTGKTKSGKK